MEMKEERTSAKRPSVVPRSDIPIAADDADLEIRPFEAHALLSEVVPRSDVEMAWTQARPGQDIALRSHATRSLLVILEGSAELVGRLHRAVGQGDVIAVPPGHQYGFRAVGPQGLHVLHVSFAGRSSAEGSESRDLAQLLARNQERMQTALDNPFYLLLQSEELKDPERRAVMCEALRVFSDAFQTILFTRQATCRDERFARVFHEHLTEEIGHNELLKVSGSSRATRDPILRAASVWFCHQMLLLDNSGKAVVNLVLETAGYHFHTLASKVLADHESTDYFQTHAEDDEAHMQLGIDALGDLHPVNYRKLHQVLEDAWDMFEVMAGRIAHLVAVEGADA
jgi:mannose-6-phosphate isomerase-like protein (cupin superfamily)